MQGGHPGLHLGSARQPGPGQAHQAAQPPGQQPGGGQQPLAATTEPLSQQQQQHRPRLWRVARAAALRGVVAPVMQNNWWPRWRFRRRTRRPMRTTVSRPPAGDADEEGLALVVLEQQRQAEAARAARAGRGAEPRQAGQAGRGAEPQQAEQAGAAGAGAGAAPARPAAPVGAPAAVRLYVDAAAAASYAAALLLRPGQQGAGAGLAAPGQGQAAPSGERLPGSEHPHGGGRGGGAGPGARLRTTPPCPDQLLLGYSVDGGATWRQAAFTAVPVARPGGQVLAACLQPPPPGHQGPLGGPGAPGRGGADPRRPPPPVLLRLSAAPADARGPPRAGAAQGAGGRGRRCCGPHLPLLPLL